MRMRAAIAALAFLVGATGGRAEELRIAATIAPVHSLVSMVSEGVASSDLIIRPGASPHSYALKPSEARALNDADIVFWIGPDLELWMEKALTTLAGDAVVVELGETEGINRLAFRESGIWADHEHGEDDHGDHDHDGHIDPHLWLDPNNALIWVEAIAEALAERDSANADAYLRNAKAAIDQITATVEDIDKRLQPVKETAYVVFHDAYQYFEQRFDLHPLGAISLGDADRPGPARVIDIKQAIERSGAICVFAEPQFEPRLIDTVIEGTEAGKGVLDPIGAKLEPGADLYPLLLRGLADNLLDCLG